MSPKKAAKHPDKKHHEAKDLRRAYEHMGLVEILQQISQPLFADEVNVLGTMAQQALQSGHPKEAAELLRSAEHLSFASLAGENAKSGRLAEDLEKAIMDEFEHLTGNAEEHWEHGGDRHKAITAIYKNSLKKANQAMKQREYHRALELARG